MSETAQTKGDAGAGGDLERMLALGQGWYFLVTGVWPILHMRSFEWVTGPKVDKWLVKTAGVLITAVGATLAMAGRRGRGERPPDEIPLLAVGSAAGLTAIDVVYVAKKRISPVYLLDAVAEVALIGAWVVALRARRER
jgi:hypothetical protein